MARAPRRAFLDRRRGRDARARRVVRHGRDARVTGECPGHASRSRTTARNDFSGATGGRVKGRFAAHRKRVFAAAADALADLEAAGAFGAGPARDGLTVFFSVSDSDDAPKLQRQSARRANPKAVYDRFLKSGG